MRALDLPEMPIPAAAAARGPETGVDRRIADTLARASRYAAPAGVVVGLAVIIGWLLDIPALKSGGHPDVVTMKFNTALGFLAVSVALWFLHPLATNASSARRRAGTALGLGVVALGALTLLQHLTGADLGIDQVFVRDEVSPIGSKYPGRMAPMTAFNFVALGLAVVALPRAWRHGNVAQGLAALVAAGGLLGVLGYIYAVPQVRGNALFGTMAIHTALTFLALALAVLCARPHVGFMRVLASSTSGGIWARRLVPSVLVFSMGLGWLGLRGQEAGLYGTEFGVVLVVCVVWLFVTAMALGAARALDAAEAARRQATAELRRWAELFGHAQWGVALVADGERIAAANPAFDRLHGRAPGASVGLRITEQFAPQSRELIAAALAAAAAGGHRAVEARQQRADGSSFPSLVDVSAVRDADDRLTGIGVNVQDISELKTVEQRALKAKEELETFSYSVAHDLRAPLRSINGFSRILRQQHAGQLNEDARECLQHVAEGAVRMGQLIDDLLALAQISRANLHIEDLDLSDVATRVIDDLRRGEPGREVEVHVQEGLRVKADGKLMRIALENLLGNAWKYSGKVAHARIDVGADPDGAIYVRDNGAGFDMAYAGKLFGAFHRLHAPTEFEGTGVGLATVKRILDRHGGRVWAEGRIDKGATFRFSLDAGTPA